MKNQPLQNTEEVIADRRNSDAYMLNYGRKVSIANFDENQPLAPQPQVFYIKSLSNNIKVSLLATVNKLKVDQEHLKQLWAAGQRTTKEDWAGNFSFEKIKKIWI